MSLRRKEALDAERFRMRLQNRLKGSVTLPFGQELWEYRTLVEKKKTRRIFRIINTMGRFATTKVAFPFPTKAEQFVQQYEDSDSSYGRDEGILYEGYYVVDNLYNALPGRKLYMCKKTLFSKSTKKEMLAVRVINLKKVYNDYIYKILPNELDVILRVKHPFIIETLCVLYRKKQYFIFMRYAEKGDLFTHLVNYGGVTEHRSRVWIGQLASAVDFLHSLDFVHRDICCENVLITQHNNLKLTDFENAVSIQYDMGRPIPLVHYAGTLEYATPEVLAGRPYHAKGADTWALIVVLYAMITAKLPFAGNVSEKLIASQRNWKFQYSNYYSEDLARLFQRMFEFKSRHRYNLERFMNSKWLKKSDFSVLEGDINNKEKASKGESRPREDPARLRLVEDPAQEYTDGGQVVHLQPFLTESDSTCTLIPIIGNENDMEETMSEDQSYGIPFTPGEEYKTFLGKLAKHWERKKDPNQKKKRSRKTKYN